MNLRRSPKFTILLFFFWWGWWPSKYIGSGKKGCQNCQVQSRRLLGKPCRKERKSFFALPAYGTTNIVKKNLFDPARVQAGKKVAEPVPQSKQGPEEFVLLGTMITSRGRKAHYTSPSRLRAAQRVRRRRTSANAKSNRSGEVRRISLGDPVGNSS